MAFQLNQKQIPETYALKGGTQAWKTAGYPMEGTSSSNTSGAPNPPSVSQQNTAPQNY